MSKQVLPERKTKFAEDQSKAPLLGDVVSSNQIDLEAAKYQTSALHVESIPPASDSKVLSKSHMDI